MFLKSLTARAIVPVAVAVTGFVVICCILLYSVMKADMINDAVIYETNLADTIVKSTRYAMLKSDRDMLSNIICNVGQQKGVEHVRIFNKKGLIMFSEDPTELNRFVDKKTAGCIGRHSCRDTWRNGTGAPVRQRPGNGNYCHHRSHLQRTIML